MIDTVQTLDAPKLLQGALSACTGSSATDTHVSSAPIHESHLSGDAEVAQATLCDRRCQPIGGSDILLTLNGTSKTLTYEIALAEGHCPVPSRIVGVIGVASGAVLKRDGVRAHVDVPTYPLTKTDYMLIAREKLGSRAVACGAIAGDSVY